MLKHIGREKLNSPKAVSFPYFSNIISMIFFAKIHSTSSGFYSILLGGDISLNMSLSKLIYILKKNSKMYLKKNINNTMYEKNICITNT